MYLIFFLPFLLFKYTTINLMSLDLDLSFPFSFNYILLRDIQEEKGVIYSIFIFIFIVYPIKNITRIK